MGITFHVIQDRCNLSSSRFVIETHNFCATNIEAADETSCYSQGHNTFRVFLHPDACLLKSVGIVQDL
jgi:hypothetical protein